MSTWVRRTAIWIPVVVIALLALPMVLTSRSFGHDWTLHLWLLREQQWNIRTMGHPGLFVSAEPLGAFYPMFAFVGSGIYSLGAYLAIVLGDRPILAYKLLYALALCMAYGGFTWLAVQRGLRGWRSQMPGLVFVTGAYFVTQMYGIGDLGEFVALSSIPLLVAAACSILTTRATRHRDLLALVLAVFVLSGSNNITLLWGSAFLVALGVLAAIVFAPTWPRPLPVRRLVPLALGGALGLGLNAWYLFPDLKYGLDTVIARDNRGVLPLTFLEGRGLLLNPLRTADAAHNALAIDIRVTLPWLFVAWALYIAYRSWRREDVVAKRMFVALVALGAAYFVFAVAKTPWHLLPHFFYNIQFTRRLHAYLLLATALVVLTALRWQEHAVERVKRATTIALAVIAIFTVGTATWQVWRVHSQYHVVGAGAVATGKTFNTVVVKSRFTVPPSWYVRDEFRDGALPTVVTKRYRQVSIPVTKVRGTKFAGTLAVPDGPAPFRTNLSSGPQFVKMTGIRAVGRTGRGLIVAVRAPNAPPTGPVAVTIEQSDTKALTAGALVSAVSALGLVALLLWPLARLLGRKRETAGTVSP